MEKALEKINQMINTCEALSSHGALYRDLKIVKAYIEEAMKPKTCGGCKLENRFGATCCECSRQCKDYYEPKDT